MVILILAILVHSLSATDPISTFNSLQEKTEGEALSYQKMKNTTAYYLGLRDIPMFIWQYNPGPRVLDFGCKVGLTSQFLCNHNFEVVGVDSNDYMVAQASKNCPTIPFYKIENNTLPFPENSFDLVCSSFMVLCQPNKELMTHYFNEAGRVLKKDGLVVVLTVHEDFYKNNWVNIVTDYPENKNLQSGDSAKALAVDINLKFLDYYWTHQDCIESMNRAGLQLVNIHFPLGKDGEPFAWVHEKTKSPFVVFIARAS